MAAASEYPPRNEKEKFQDFIEYVLEDDTERVSAALSGIAACETAKKYKDRIFYGYDLSLCTDEKTHETCHGDFLNEAVRNAYNERGSKSRNIAVFTNAATLKECNEITKFNALWSLVDGRKFQNINVLLLFEENFPRHNLSESIGILSYIGLQRKRCREEFRDNDFNAQAFASRLTEFHVEQEPENKNCNILNYIETTSTSHEKEGGFLKSINPFVLLSASATIIAMIFTSVIWGTLSMLRQFSLNSHHKKKQEDPYIAKTGTN
jgi:hypothetical protein